MQQLTSLNNNKEQQLPVSYRTKDKISEYQLQFRAKSPQRSIDDADKITLITNDDDDTSLEFHKVTKDDDEFSQNNNNHVNGLNLTELNNNKPQTLNHNLCEENGITQEDGGSRKTTSMGSNVSRYSEKGLSGRRAHSSGNLFSGNATNNATNTPSKKAHNKKFKKKSRDIADDLSDVASISTTIGVPCGGMGGGGYDNASFTDPCIVNDISLQQLYSPYNSSRGKQQKQTYHGSLPNHLDDTDEDVVDGVMAQQRGKS